MGRPNSRQYLLVDLAELTRNPILLKVTKDVLKLSLADQTHGGELRGAIRTACHRLGRPAASRNLRRALLRRILNQLRLLLLRL